MLKKVLYGCAFVAMLLSSGAQADTAKKIIQVIHGPFFICANDGFLLQQSGNSYHLTGPLFVPGPGYTFDVSDIEVSMSGVATGTVTFKAPEEQTKKFITPQLNLDKTFTSDEQVSRLNVSIAKDWPWGDVRIVCSRGG